MIQDSSFTGRRYPFPRRKGRSSGDALLHGLQEILPTVGTKLSCRARLLEEYRPAWN